MGLWNSHSKKKKGITGPVGQSQIAKRIIGPLERSQKGSLGLLERSQIHSLIQLDRSTRPSTVSAVQREIKQDQGSGEEVPGRAGRGAGPTSPHRRKVRWRRGRARFLLNSRGMKNTLQSDHHPFLKQVGSLRHLENQATNFSTNFSEHASDNHHTSAQAKTHHQCKQQSQNLGKKQQQHHKTPSPPIWRKATKTCLPTW